MWEDNKLLKIIKSKKWMQVSLNVFFYGSGHDGRAVFAGGKQHLHKFDSLQVDQETVPRTWWHKKFLT